MRVGGFFTGMVAGLVGLVLAVPVASAGDPPRLKYRAKGSVCSCASGLGEAEISRAMAGLDRLGGGAGPEQRSGEAKDSEQQQRREADEKRQ